MEDPGVREDLALASLFSGMCLANSGLGAVHGLAAAAGARLSRRTVQSAPVLAAAVEVNLRALRERAPEHPALPRLASGDAAHWPAGRIPEDAIAWLRELTAALSIPGLASYGLDQAEIDAVVAAAQRASSMRGNPIELSEKKSARSWSSS